MILEAEVTIRWEAPDTKEGAFLYGDICEAITALPGVKATVQAGDFQEVADQ